MLNYQRVTCGAPGWFGSVPPLRQCPWCCVSAPRLPRRPWRHRSRHLKRRRGTWPCGPLNKRVKTQRLTASIGKYGKMWEKLWNIYHLVGEIKEIWAIIMEIYVPKRVNSYSWENIWTFCISTHFGRDMFFLLMWNGCHIEHEWHQKIGFTHVFFSLIDMMGKAMVQEELSRVGSRGFLA